MDKLTAFTYSLDPDQERTLEKLCTIAQKRNRQQFEIFLDITGVSVVQETGSELLDLMPTKEENERTEGAIRSLAQYGFVRLELLNTGRFSGRYLVTISPLALKRLEFKNLSSREQNRLVSRLTKEANRSERFEKIGFWMGIVGFATSMILAILEILERVGLIPGP